MKPAGRLRPYLGRLLAVLAVVLAAVLPLHRLSLGWSEPSLALAQRSGAGSTGLQPLGVTPAGTVSTSPGPVQESVQPQHYVVLIVMDAGRASYLTLGKLPHIDALMKHGVVYYRAWVGEMESSTPDVHVTFGTGTLPRENGFLGFGWAAPDTRKTVDFRSLLADHAIDPVLNALPTPSVATRMHQDMPNEVSIAASGHKDYAVVGLGGGSANYELYGKFTKNRMIPTFMHTPPPLTRAERKALTVKSPLPYGAEDRWAFQYASDVALHVRPRLLMMNLPELDTWGHWRGPADTKFFTQLMGNVDQGLGRLEDTYRKLGILNQTDFIITADHSMMQSRAAKNWHDVWAAAQAAKAEVVRADGEGGSVWLQDPSKAKAVADHLVAMHPAHVEAIFYRSAVGLDYRYQLDSPTSWLVSPDVAQTLQTLVNTTAGRNGPDLWVLYRENYTVVPRNVDGTWKGTHGGSTWLVQHVPLIMSGPGIRSGVYSAFPARAVDIAPTLEQLLGLPPIKRDGVALADALVSPPKAEVAAENQIYPTLAAEVHALQVQSAADSHHSPEWPTPPGSKNLCPAASGPGFQRCQTTAATATNE